MTMLMMYRRALTAALILGCATTTTAHAHFKLTAPASWLNEGAQGDPQKGSPCGPGGYDNVNPIPESGAITEYHAGETIQVEWTDTIAHPGYFRIALAENRDDLKNPTLVQDGNCAFDESMVPTTAQGNVLADGIAFRSRMGFNEASGEVFSQEVTLPNTPCENCTLQVMQVMENDLKALSQCYYFHCANIKILPAEGAAGVGVAGTAAPVGAAGVSAAGAPASSTTKSGCTVAQLGGGESQRAWFGALAMLVGCALVRRRAARRATC